MAVQLNTKDASDQFIVSRGILFPDEPDILDWRTRRALPKDDYEKKESLAILKLVKPGDVVMELGGGIGYNSTLIAKQTKAERVHSFEANPELIPYIRKVHDANQVRNATVENAVLGVGNADTTFFVRRNFLSSSLDSKDGSGVVSEHNIPVLDIKETLKRIAPSVLVCDIEGGEVDLIPEMDLSGLRAAVIELHPQLIGKDGVKQIFDAMHAAGLIYFPRWSDAKVVCFRRDWQ
jgi:FkbM family methyltransferase